MSYTSTMDLNDSILADTITEVAFRELWEAADEARTILDTEATRMDLFGVRPLAQSVFRRAEQRLRRALEATKP